MSETNREQQFYETLIKANDKMQSFLEDAKNLKPVKKECLSKMIHFTNPGFGDSFISSRFINDERVSESIPFSAIIPSALNIMHIKRAAEVEEERAKEITIMKSASCGKTETLSEALSYDFNKRKQEKLNNYMNYLKERYGR